LAGRCLECHSGAEAKGKLDLSAGAKAVAGGESGAAIETGKPDASNLWQWITAGAKWGTEAIDPFRYTSAARAGYDWWSLQPLRGAEKVRSEERGVRN